MRRALLSVLDYALCLILLPVAIVLVLTRRFRRGMGRDPRIVKGKGPESW